MGEDKSGKLKEKETRPVLGNITNLLGKRGFDLISTNDSASKSKSGNNNVADDADSDSSFWKKVSLAENLEKERTTSAKCPKILKEVGLSPLKGGKTYRILNNSSSMTSNARKGLPAMPSVVNDKKEPSSSALDSIDLDADVVNVCETAKEGCDSRVKVGDSLKSCDKDCVDGGNECQGEVAREISDDTNEVEVLSTQPVVDNASKPELDVSSRMTEVLEMKGFGLERCNALKGDDGCSLAAGVDLIKQCLCSFCTKAAYIWSDLHYQDVKSRISTLSKSGKEASNLAQKYYGGTESSSHAPEKVTQVEQLESDLMNKWRSLFLHMEGLFASEGSQLEKQFLALKDLGDDFKMNLEILTGVPVDVLQCSSDASDHTR